MTQKKFLLQGFTAETHLTALEHLFACPNLERVILGVAFINKSGIDLIANQMKTVATQVEVFAGIRNEITTRQGLEQILALGSVLNVVDTGTRQVTFHPKIYYARGKNEARIVIGSANLTIGGLNNNIEASITLDLDLTNVSNSNIATDIENEFSKLTKTYPEHVLRITKASELILLQDEGRLVDESASSPPQETSNIKTEKADGLSRIQLKVSPIFPPNTRNVRPSTSKSKSPTDLFLGPNPNKTKPGVSLEKQTASRA